jgi:hypothetical protein
MRAHLFQALNLFMNAIAMVGWVWLIFGGVKWLSS